MENQMKTKILVTGGAGYIGSHTCKLLAAHGYEPITIDNLVNGHKWAVKWGELITGDIQDAALLDTVFERYQPSAVIHFAGYIDARESLIQPIKFYQNNVSCTLSLLNAMHRHNCKKIIFSSSCAIYGIPDKVPITEDMAQKPISPYGRSKLMVEQMLQDSEYAYGIKHILLRYFNAAGADLSGDIGECHDPENHIIPLLLKTAMGKNPYFTIFGTNYPTKDGTPVRDYIHVTDLAMAHLMALNDLLNNNQSQAFNVGSEQGHSVNELIEMVRKVTHANLTLKEGPPDPGDPPELVADATKIKKQLNWVPQFSDLETLVQSAWQWYVKSNC
jgi:UDP-glucose-4-epimerase GalE